MAEEWTEDERDFLRSSRTVFGILTGDRGVVGEAEASAIEAVRVLKGRYPNRAHRLLIFQALAVEMKKARDEVLRGLLEGTIDWHQREGGDWATVGLQDHEVVWLAELAGVTPRTVKTLYDKMLRESYAALEAREDAVVKGHG